MAPVVLRIRPGTDAELVLDIVWSGTPIGLEERGDELLVGYDDPAGAETTLRELAGRWPASIEAVPDPSGWRDTWRDFAEPVTVGRVTLVPAWLPILLGDVVIELDPGQAFGSGSHPTTRLAVAALERAVRPGSSVLDLGCGSGVLAIVAARLGASTVLGVDTDPAAHEATAANAARNGVHVELLGSLDEAPPVDVVVANIGAGTLIDLAPVVAPLAPLLLLTGILAGREAEVAAAYAGFHDVQITVDDGWVLLHLANFGP